MNNLLFIDIETQSAVSIKDASAYIAHPSTRIASVVAKHLDTITVWVPSGRMPVKDIVLPPCGIKTEIVVSDTPPFDPRLTWVAHNAYGFDARIWERFHPSPIRWIDTMPMQLSVGKPGRLEGKTDNDALAMLMTAKVNHDGIYRYPFGNAVLWRKMLDYNRNDVIQLEKTYKELAPHFNEWDLLQLDFEINRRGMWYDRELARQLLMAWASVQHDAGTRIEEITKGALKEADLQSPAKVKKFLNGLGANLESLNKNVLEEQLSEYEDSDHETTEVIFEVLRARQTVTRNARGKIARLLSESLSSRDTRLRHTLKFHGAHTGRWSGRGLQPQNLARIGETDIQTPIQFFESCGRLPADVTADQLSAMTRAVFAAPEGRTLYVADFAAIEARCLAWLAGEESRLSIYRVDGDVYCSLATKIFGRDITRKDKAERQTGKIIELGAGYGMSGAKAEIFCRRNKPKIDLAALGLTGKQVIDTYRASVPKIKDFWSGIERTCIATIQTRTAHVYGGLVVDMFEDAMRIKLLSGRYIWYRQARIENLVPAYVALYNLPPHKKPTIVYRHPHNRDGILYGGLLTENVVQATCRDLLAHSLLNVAKSFDIVLHVHDEIVVEDDAAADRLAEFETTMKRLPDWANGFPVGVEAHKCRRYLK